MAKRAARSQSSVIDIGAVVQVPMSAAMGGKEDRGSLDAYNLTLVCVKKTGENIYVLANKDGYLSKGIHRTYKVGSARWLGVTQPTIYSSS